MKRRNFSAKIASILGLVAVSGKTTANVLSPDEIVAAWEKPSQKSLSERARRNIVQCQLQNERDTMEAG